MFSWLVRITTPGRFDERLPGLGTGSGPLARWHIGPCQEVQEKARKCQPFARRIARVVPVRGWFRSDSFVWLPASIHYHRYAEFPGRDPLGLALMYQERPVTKLSDASNRSAGILLHPTSLPGPYGIGDLGRAAYAWVDALVRARQTWWQILPLGPTGYGDSPYQCFSAFAGNRYLVSPELLVRDGLLKQDDLAGVRFPAEYVDFGSVIPFKLAMLTRAWENFLSGAAASLRSPFETFCVQEARWLNDFALFSALKDAHGGANWQDWPHELKLRQPAALREARRQLSRAIGLHQFTQFLFFRQWKELKHYANSHGIYLIGDAPIFVASDS